MLSQLFSVMIPGLARTERNGMMDTTLIVSAMAIRSASRSIHADLRFSAAVNRDQILFKVSGTM